MRMLDSLCSSQILQSALELTAKYTSLPFCLSTKANNKNESKKLTTTSRHMNFVNRYWLIPAWSKSFFSMT